MNLPSNLALGGSLEAVKQRRSCMAPSGVIKEVVTAEALSEATLVKNSTVIILRACNVLCNNISKHAGAILYSQ